MSKFIFVSFPDEAKAYQGTRSLEELHAEGSLTLYAMAVMAKASDGKLSVKLESERGPFGMAVGALVGGMIGLLGGPVGAAIGVGGGALLGMLNDLSNLGVSGEFLDKVALDLTPGKVAVIAEVSEDWVTPLDTRMNALGGIVHRTGRADVEDELSQKEMAAIKTELSQLEAEYEHSKTANKARLRARIEEVEVKAQGISDRLHHQLTSFKEETAAKLKSLHAQADTATGEAKMRIEDRLKEIRADEERRTIQLKRGWGLTKKAVA